MGLLDIFKRKKLESPWKGHVLDYHEDDFCRIELLPRESFNEINNDMNEIDEINRNHSSQYGYSKIHVLKEKKVKTADRIIPLIELKNILEDGLFRKFDNVTTGYGSKRYDSEYSTAYGEPGCAIIYERKGNEVERIWLKYFPAWADEQNRKKMERCLTRICNNWNLVLVDWRYEVVVDVSNIISLQKYLNGEIGE